MGKTSMCLQMLQILNSGRVYKVSELAGLLDTNSRNIIEYKKELEECGYYITTIPGRYGGYLLEKSVLMPSLKLSPEEKKAFDNGYNYLLSRNDYINKEDLQKAAAKIYSSNNNKELNKNFLIINRYPLVMSEKDLQDRFNLIQDCIATHRKILMTYRSQKNYEREYVFHPYDLFMYNNAWFVIGWNEYYNDVLYFKINRITKLERTNDKFVVLRGYELSNYVDQYGFKSDNEWFHVKFIAKNVYASLVQERIYGQNQIVTIIDQKNTQVEVDMKNKESILTFILGFGKSLEVIEPQWLKDEIKNFAEYINDKYKS